MTLHVNDGGTWKTATPYVKDAGAWKPIKEIWVKDAGTWKKAYASVTVTVSMSPGIQGLSGTVASRTFNSETVTVTGGTPTAYLWEVVPNGNETWTINSGQGTATAAPRVTGVASGTTATATLFCTVTVGGAQYSTSTTLAYTRS